MTPAALQRVRLAVAKLCGWTAVACTVCGNPGFVAKTPDGDTLWRGDGSYDDDDVILRNCHNYEESLDACAQFERGLDCPPDPENPKKERRAYRDNLAQQMEVAWYQSALLLHATPLQRCLALLKLRLPPEEFTEIVKDQPPEMKRL